MTGETGREPPPQDYRLTYHVTLPDGCPVRETGGTVTDVTVLVTGQERWCELLVLRESGVFSVEKHSQPVGNPCPCSAVIDHGTVPHVEPAEEPGTMNVAIHVRETTDAQAITERLESVAPDAELVDYTALESKGDVPITVDLDALTEKRWAALECAISSGYYETPSRTTIGEMADELGISSSAFSIRLRKAEWGVFEQLRRSI